MDDLNGSQSQFFEMRMSSIEVWGRHYQNGELADEFMWFSFGGDEFERVVQPLVISAFPSQPGYMNFGLASGGSSTNPTPVHIPISNVNGIFTNTQPLRMNFEIGDEQVIYFYGTQRGSQLNAEPTTLLALEGFKEEMEILAGYEDIFIVTLRQINW